MNTLQLRYFLELSRTLNYSAAAQKLFITQPTLSRSIMALEEEIGTKLFYRESGNVSLTPAGKLFLQELEPLELRYSGLLQRVRNLGCGLAGELHIALASEQQMPDRVMSAVKRFSAEYPNVEFRFSRMGTEDMMTALQEDVIDAAIGLSFMDYRGPRQDMPFQYVVLEQEPPCLVRASDQSGCTVATITLEECRRLLETGTLIFPAPKITAEVIVDPLEPLRNMLHLPELEPEVRYVRDASAVSLYVSAGRGITLTNKTHCIAQENGVELLEIPAAEPYQKVFQYRKGFKNPVLESFFNYL